MAIQVSQSTLNILIGQRDAQRALVTMYEQQIAQTQTQRDDADRLADELDLILADIEVV